MQLKTLVIAAGLLVLPVTALAQPAPVEPNASLSDSGSGWVAGAHIGHNWQRGALVYGLETDISWTNLDSEIAKNFSSLLAPAPSARASASVDWFGTVRGRLGWTNGPVLFYATGGFAYGNVDLRSRFNIGQGLGIPVLNSDTSSVKTGWVVGAGMNYLWRPDLSLNLNYQYVDLGTLHISDSSAISQRVSAHAGFHTVTVGLSWLFAPEPAVRRPTQPWEGMYAGAQVGGAWGLDTDARYSSALASDIRLKRDIALVGRRHDGLGLYRYRYLWSDQVYVGVMAQEVALIRPDAVVRNAADPYLRVDYTKLGLKLVALAN